MQRVRNRLKHVLTYLHSPKWLTQMRGYIYATAAVGVGGGFEADSRHAACPPAPCTMPAMPPACLPARCASASVLCRGAACVLLCLPINATACVSRVAARLQAMAAGWVDMFNLIATRRYGTSAYCYLLSWRDCLFVGGLEADRAIRRKRAFEDGSRSTIGMPPDSQYP